MNSTSKSLIISWTAFGGSDGGARFFRLKTALETYEHDENPAAAELLKIMTTFSRLIDAVNR